MAAQEPRPVVLVASNAVVYFVLFATVAWHESSVPLGWLAVVAFAVLAVAAGAGEVWIANLLAGWLDQRRQDKADLRGLTEGSAVTVRDRLPRDARVHEAVRQDVPYLPRDVEAKVGSRLRRDRRVLIVGGSMSGKTRLALAAAQAEFGEYHFYEPADGKSLHRLREKGQRLDQVLVWLDDLERFTGAGGLIDADLTTLLEAEKVAVIATIRTSEYAKLHRRGDFKPPGRDATVWFGDPIRLQGWSDDELERLAVAVADPVVLNNARRYGLSNYLGGAPLVDRRLVIGQGDNPEGYGLIAAAADWRRAGMPGSSSLDTLTKVLPAYVPGRHPTTVQDQVRTGLAWARTPIDQTVVLLVKEADGFRVLDLVLDRFVDRGQQIPDLVWQAAVEVASPAESADVGLSSYGLGRLDVAERALRKAVGRRAAASADKMVAATAGFNLGVVRCELGWAEEALAAYRQVDDLYAADPALREQVANALYNTGVTLGELGRAEEALAAFRQVEDRYADDPALSDVVERARRARTPP